MKNKYIIQVIILALLAVVFLLFGILGTGKTEKKQADGEENRTQTEVSQNNEETLVQEEQYQSPVDFEKLKKKNPDIYAWIKIEGTNIDYPLLQSQTDDKFYLDHNDEKKYDVNGVIFSEHLYNSSDFDDPVHVVYGHHLRSGDMFGNLQQDFTDRFDELKDITVFTEKEELHYHVFAAVPFSNRHILYYYDCFSREGAIEEFLEDIYKVRAIGSMTEKDYPVDANDQLLVLSTCLQGDRSCRFIVAAKKVDSETDK